jgi:hypothetical protein
VRRLAPILFILVAATAVLAVGAPLLVDGLVPAILEGSPPLAGQPVRVTATSSVGGLVRGRLDSVTVSGTSVAFGSTTIAGLDVTLRDVGLDRTFASISGSASGVTSDALADGPISLSGVSIDGSSASGVTLTGSIDASAVEPRIIARLAAAGIARAQATLGDGVVKVTADGRTIDARFVVDGAMLALDVGAIVPPVTILSGGGSMPGRVSSVQVSASGVVVTWTIDGPALATLLHG